MKLHQLDEGYQETSTAGFTKRMVHQVPDALVFVLNFEPGQTLPPHSHANSEVVLAVMSGEGQATVDGRAEAIRPGTLLQCDGAETLSVENTGGSRLSLLVFLYPGNPRFAGNVR